MNITTAKFLVTGVTPVLLKKMNPEDLQGGDSPKLKTKIDPKAEAEKAAHRLPSGQLGLPSEGFRKGLILASRGYKFGKNQAGSIIKASIMTNASLVGLIDPETKQPISEYEVDEQTVVNKKAGNARQLCYRPRIMKWACIVELLIDTDFLPNPEIILPIFSRAGSISGAGSYRPEKGGTFGKFQVEMLNGNS